CASHDIIPLVITPTNFINLTGQRFGLLTVVRRSPNNTPSGQAKWECSCECGGKAITTSTTLRSGHTKSCGCLVKEACKAMGVSMRTHGSTGTAEFKAWDSMRQRCNNPNASGYQRYGGRGIKICP